MFGRAIAGVVACFVGCAGIADEVQAPYQTGLAVRTCQEYLESGGNDRRPDEVFVWWVHAEACFTAWNVLGEGPGAQVGRGEPWTARAKALNAVCQANPSLLFGKAVLGVYLDRLEQALADEAPVEREAPVEEAEADNWRILLAPDTERRF